MSNQGAGKIFTYIALIVALLIVGAAFLLLQRPTSPTSTSTSAPSRSSEKMAIEDDFKADEMELDTTDIDKDVDSGLNKIDSDAP